MKIVVNGDSFTHERHFAVGNDFKEKTWAHSIGAENIALGGCSNDRIFFSTIEYLNNNIPDVLIIGWTSFDRGFLTNTNGLNLHITPRSIADDLLHGFNNNLTNPYSEFHEFYYKKMCNQFLNFRKFLTFYLHIEKYCRSNGIKFLNFMSFSFPGDQELQKISASAYMSRDDKDVEAQGIKYNYNVLKKELEKFKKENWIENKVGFSYSEHVAHLPKWHDGHPGLEASSEWSNLIKRNLTRND